MNLKKYELNGWANLCRDGFTQSHTDNFSYSKPVNMIKKITNVNDITILIDRFDVHNKEQNNTESEEQNNIESDEEQNITLLHENYKNNYNKTYASKNGFTLIRIFGLINDTYYQCIDDHVDGDDDLVNNLSLTGFIIVNDKIYANTDS